MPSPTLLVAFLAAAAAAEPPGPGGGSPTSPYPRMAAIDAYLIADRDEEVTLARSAAPASVSSRASVLVLGRTGHETAASGDNGFVCVVMRSWGGPAFVDGRPFADFWNPKVRAPICFNPQGSQSALPVYVKKTELALQGKDLDSLLGEVNRAFGTGTLTVPGPSTMAYMMSPRQYLGDGVRHFKPHLMLYVPYARNADWSGPDPIHDVFVGVDEANPQAIVIVPLPRWSDGTQAGR